MELRSFVFQIYTGLGAAGHGFVMPNQHALGALVDKHKRSTANFFLRSLYEQLEFFQLYNQAFHIIIRTWME